MKEGDKALKTGLFQWSPDWPKASARYHEAVKLYEKAGEEKK